MYPWKVGGGRTPRQPGQIRKEAAPTRFGAGHLKPAFHLHLNPVRLRVLRHFEPALRCLAYKISDLLWQAWPNPVLPVHELIKTAIVTFRVKCSGSPPRANSNKLSLAVMTKADKDTSTHSSYRVLARKYRPRSFDDLIGQEPMVRTLSNAFETGRIATFLPEYTSALEKIESDW